MQHFSEEMHVSRSGYLQCISCNSSGAPKPWISGSRPCISCNLLKHNNFFSHKQLKSGKGSKCVQCMGKATCSQCMIQLPLEAFSSSQLGKGFRVRRCKDCCTPPPGQRTKGHKGKKYYQAL